MEACTCKVIVQRHPTTSQSRVTVQRNPKCPEHKPGKPKPHA